MDPSPPPDPSDHGPGPVNSGRMPLIEHLGMKVSREEPGRCRVGVLVGEIHLRTLGMMHGGVAATLLDTALGLASASLAPEGHHVVTAQLNVHFLRPATLGEELVALGEVRHRGRRTAVAAGEVRNAEGAIVAMATGTFMYVLLPEGALGAGR